MQPFLAGLARALVPNGLAPIACLVMFAGLASIEPPRHAPGLVPPVLVQRQAPPALEVGTRKIREPKSVITQIPDSAPDRVQEFLRDPLLAGLAIEPPEPSVFVTLLPMPRPRAPVRLVLLAEAVRWVDATPRTLGVRFDLWCAAAVNKFLRNIGRRGTGSDLAASFARFGRKLEAPVPGAIAVKPRHGGNHVVVVVKLLPGDRLLAVSPNGGGGRVRLSTYARSDFYAFRDPGV